MESKRYSYQVGLGTVSFYGASITDADIIMTDGKSLENIGVNPDEVVLPTAADLANDRDPVLAHAAQLAGVRLSPEAAGKMFPYEWPHE
jgi:C-terminal processing protease CtpA/Prc